MNASYSYVVVFTLNRSFYPTTSAVPPVSFLIHPRDTNYVVRLRQRKIKRQRIKAGKSSASVPGTRAQQKKRHPRNKSYEKKTTKRIKNKIIPRWGRVQMTQAERTRTIKYVLAESSRWLLHRRRDTKKINIPGCRKKIRKERKEKRKTKSRKQGTKASKKIVLKASP